MFFFDAAVISRRVKHLLVSIVKKLSVKSKKNFTKARAIGDAEKMFLNCMRCNTRRSFLEDFLSNVNANMKIMLQNLKTEEMFYKN